MSTDEGKTTMQHQLKVWPEFFEAILDGRKRFEIRKTLDRWFQVGDELILVEWDPRKAWGNRTGRTVSVRVTYLMAGAFGLPADLCVMGIEPIPAERDERGEEE